MTPTPPASTAQDGRDPEALIGAERVLAKGDHNRDVGGIELRVTALATPSRDLLRISCVPLIPLDSEAWSRGNVSVRIQVSGGEDEANDGTPGGIVSRVYTVRTFNPTTQEMDIDVVLHPGESPMMRWVSALAAGDTFRLTGPRQHFLPPEPSDHPVALFLDETAIPALYSILADWPAGRRAEAWIECPVAAPVAELPVVPGVTVHHLERPAGSTGGSTGALVAAATSLTQAAEHVIWAAGERDEMRQIRSHFRTEIGLPKEQVAVYGYWKQGTSTSTIDRHRLRAYTEALANGGGVDDLDDLGIGI